MGQAARRTAAFRTLLAQYDLTPTRVALSWDVPESVVINWIKGNPAIPEFRLRILTHILTKHGPGWLKALAEAQPTLTGEDRFFRVPPTARERAELMTLLEAGENPLIDGLGRQVILSNEMRRSIIQRLALPTSDEWWNAGAVTP